MENPNDLMFIQDSDTMSNEETVSLEVVESLVMGDENIIHHALEGKMAQGPNAMPGQSQDDSDIPTPRSATPDDDVSIDVESSIVERVGESDDPDREQEDVDSEDEEFLPLATTSASEYCLLCRARFPLFDLFKQPNNDLYEPWQSQIRAVAKISRDGQKCIAVTDVIVLEGRSTIEAPIAGWSPSSIIAIEPAPSREVHIDKFSSCFHDWCYSIFTWEFGPNKLELLYKMALSLQPSTTWERHSDIHGPLYPQFECDSILSRASDGFVELQPLFLADLPPEIRSRIWNFVGSSTAYSALILVTGETSKLAHQIQTPGVIKIAVTPGYFIEASFISMYGTQYIQSLVTKKSSHTGTNKSIKITEIITGIEVISSVHGICCMRFLSSDWKSDWLGNVARMTRCWYGTIPLSNEVLVCFYNGLTIEEVAGSHQRNIRQVMWDRPDHPEVAFDADGALFTLFQPDELYQKEMSSLGFFRYISLTDNDFYASGITIHFLSECITGIESHFPTTSNLVGSHGDTTLHFPLAQSERIANVWLRLKTHGLYYSVPSLLIHTTLGRYHSLGPYIGPGRYSQYRWILLKQSGCVAGFYFENSTRIRRLGVIGDGKLATEGVPIPRYETCEPTLPYIGFFGKSLFVNDAKIEDLNSVVACKIGARCIGILIDYIDETMPAAVLGQWLDSQRSKHTCIYNRSEWNETPPSTIIFKSSDRGTFVEDIEFCSHNNEFISETIQSDGLIQCFPVGTRIAWWFTSKWDSIRMWKPRLEQSTDIPLEYELTQD